MAAGLSNNYGLPEGFTLDEENFSAENNYGLPEGFTLDEVQEQVKPQQNIVDQGLRLGGQFAIGGLQGAALPYDLASIASKKITQVNAPHEFRQTLLDDLNYLIDQKSLGNFDEQDQQRYDQIIDLLNNPDKMQQYLPENDEMLDFDVGSLIERGAKSVGVDLTPQNKAEMAARWIGFIKNPKKALELMKNPNDINNLKEIGKALLPSGKEFARGSLASEALQYAADAEFGPIGTMTILALADAGPSMVEGTINFAKQPKKFKTGVSKAIKLFTPKDKLSLQRDIIKDFREAGIQADAGTISGSNIIKHIQSTLDNSSLTGDALEKLKKNLTQDIVNEYKNLSSELGNVKFESNFEAGEALKSGLENSRQIDLATTRALYKNAKEIGGKNQIFSGNVGQTILKLQEELEPGRLKSSEQKLVQKALETLEGDFLTPSGGLRSTAVDALINNKIALNDLINYEAQGGAKQLLKGVVKEIDNALLRYGSESPEFAKNWRLANKKFSDHARLFRGKSIKQALLTENPEQIFKKMNTVHGIQQIRKALSHTPGGDQLFKKLAATKLEDIIGKNLINSTTEQLNFGTFSNLLKKAQNREIVKELLSSKSLSTLEKLQKASGRIAETNQKFFNASRTGYQATDIAFYVNLMRDLTSFFSGNPWPIAKSGSMWISARRIANFLSDPEFRKILENVILEEKKGNTAAFRKAAIKLSKKGQDIARVIERSIKEKEDDKEK